MIETILKNFLPRIVQDLVTSAVAILATHGYITQSQEQATIGSAFFLAMLAINYVLHTNRKADAAAAGAVAVGGAISSETALAIAKGKTP